jgi:hypothetical protein
MQITISGTDILTLNLTPVTTVVEAWLTQGTIANQEQTIVLKINFERAPEDPRELSEIPEIRLWFVRLDSLYPWLVFLLDWRAGELARYTAMLVPHEFHRSEGIQYNPEALEIFVMQKVFVLTQWLPQIGIKSPAKIKDMAKVLGYELDDSFFQLIGIE